MRGVDSLDGLQLRVKRSFAVSLPSIRECMEPTLRALFGAEETFQERPARVSSLLVSTNEQASLSHGGNRRTEFEHRFAWVGIKLRAESFIKPASHAARSLTAAGPARAQGSDA